MTRKRDIAVALALLASVALGACGGSSKSHSSDHAGNQQTTGSSTKTATTPAASRPLVTVGAVEQEAQLQPYRLSIYDLRRQGPYVVLDFAIACQAPASGCGTRFDFAPPGESDAALAGVNEASGVTLVDPMSDKEYGVVRDAQLHPQASELPFQSIGDHSLHLGWVKFPAPPATTRALDVVLPNGGPQIPSVPVSDTPARLPTSLGAGGTTAKPGDSAQPADSTSTAGMTLPITDLITTAGNPAGSDAESSQQATITLRTDVLFQFAKSNLTSRAKAILRPLAAKIKSRAVGPVQVTGYTDSIGSAQVNIPLSHARAAAVVSALETDLPGVQFHANGLGSADPVAPNTKPDGSDNPAGRALNRRVTITFRVKAPAPATPPAPAPAAPSGNAVTTRSVGYRVPGSDNSWQVSVNRLYREGNLAVLKLSISCALPGSQTCNGATDFIGSQSVPPITFTHNFLAQGFNAFWTLGGFYLTDSTTGTQYIPVYRGAADPLTSSINNNMRTGVSFPAWIYFSAPPASTTAVTLSFPGGSPKIGNVPIDPSPPAGG